VQVLHSLGVLGVLGGKTIFMQRSRQTDALLSDNEIDMRCAGVAELVDAGLKSSGDDHVSVRSTSVP
jgi:hypothetical protein